MKIYGKERDEIIDSIKSGKSRIAVYGLGKMGLPLAAVFADHGANVIGVDINEDVVNEINRGDCPIDEPGLKELVKRNVDGGRLKATTDAKEASRISDIVIILIPLLIDDNNCPNIKIIKDVSQIISKGLEVGDFVILETTSPLGTTEDVIKPILEESGLKAGEEFGLAHCPERTYSGRVIKDLTQSYPKIVGGIDEKSTKTAEAVYSIINKNGVIQVTNARTAEAIKVFEGVYRDVNIALANELAMICEEFGIDAREAFDAANTQPYSHIHSPGIGVGGHCIPIYPYFLIKNAKKAALLQAAREVNDSMPQHAVDIVSGSIEKVGKDLKNSKILVLGVTFRGGVKELTKSPAIEIMKILNLAGCEVYAYDPILSKEEIEKLGAEYKEDFKDIDCVIIGADHEEFIGYDWEAIAKVMANPIVLDGRCVLDREVMKGMGFIYQEIGNVVI